ncbi:MAG: YrhB domain-containing protein [Acidimicrobiales bacterium]
MIDWPTAYLAAQHHVASIPLPDGDQAVLVDALTRTVEDGWIFTYQSKRHLEHGDRDAQLVGNRPFLVRRTDGSIVTAPDHVGGGGL